MSSRENEPLLKLPIAVRAAKLASPRMVSTRNPRCTPVDVSPCPTPLGFRAKANALGIAGSGSKPPRLFWPVASDGPATSTQPVPCD